MLFTLLISLFTIICLLLILLIFLQKGKSSLGLGSMGGGAQMIFGGSGGQDIFQKATWFLVGIFLFSSLGLSIYKTQTMLYNPKSAIVS